MGQIKKKILLTGAGGFIGSYLVNTLAGSGFTVNIFDTEAILNSKIKQASYSKYSDSIGVFPGNVEIPGNLDEAVKDADHIIHLAARSFVPDSWQNPFDFYRTNVIGTSNVLDLCRQNNCRLTYLSSYVYGDPEYLPIDEKHPLKSYNPYSHSKLIAEDICEYYKKNYGVKITIFRPFNLYGPGQNGAFLIPEIIEQLVSDKIGTIEVNALNPKRDYVYIDDLVNAIILSINNSDDIFNIGSGYSLSVEEIIKTAIKISGIEKKYSSRNVNRKNEVYDVVANITKAQKMLKWSPKVSLEEGLLRCIDHALNKKV
jgi:nucleoside-diphosphate-sugar epimerase